MPCNSAWHRIVCVGWKSDAGIEGKSEGMGCEENAQRMLAGSREGRAPPCTIPDPGRTLTHHFAVGVSRKPSIIGASQSVRAVTCM